MNKHDKNQLAPSIEKLLHYLVTMVRYDAEIVVWDGDQRIFSSEYKAPREINISPTLYTRIDDCHGAGNCCRVPFDLIYTSYDRQRIIDFDYNQAVIDFGKESANRFIHQKDHLLANLQDLLFCVLLSNGENWQIPLYVLRNFNVNPKSGNKSCPYLVIS